MRKKYIFIFLLFFIVGGLASATAPAADESHSAEQEKPKVFSGYYGESIWTLVSFALLVLVLWKVAWRPLLTSIRGREEYIDKQLSDADNTLKEADRVLEEYKAKLQNVEEEGKGILNNYLKRAEREGREHTEKVRAELDELRHKLRAEIEHERRQAKEDFWDQAGDIVINLGREVIGKSMTSSDHNKLIDEAVLKLKADEPKVSD